MKPDWSIIRGHYEATGEPLRSVAKRFMLAERTLFRKASAEKWQRSGQTDDENGSGLGSNNGSNDNSAAKSGSANGSAEALAAKNGSGFGSIKGSNGNPAAKSGSANGSAEAFAAKNGSGLGSNNGSNDNSAAKSGSANGSNDNLAAKSGSAFHIPASINDWDRLTASRYYLKELGWAVHQLYPPDKGDDKERGKKPFCKGWRDHKASDVTTADLEKVFGPHTSNNLGVVVRPPFVAVDLDSKADAGQSVRAWLDEHPHLLSVPRERTGGGAHLHFICRDLPLHILKSRKPPTVQINAKVSAELYLNGFNLVVAPSIHRTGHRYTWEVTGPIPEVRWTDLNTLFGFDHPAPKSESPTPGKKDKTWWTAFKGDLATLDILALFRSADRLGDCLDPDQSKWAVRCPWEHEHSGDLKGEAGSDTVIFAGKPPGFKCLHAHCAERSMEQVCAWFENTHPGAIDDHCQQLRGTFAQETLAKNGLISPWKEPTDGALERLAHQFGEPFQMGGEDASGERQITDFNYHYWAAQFAFESLVLYEPSSNQFYCYAAHHGIWWWQTEACIRDQIAAYLLDYSRRLNQPILETRRTPERLVGMIVALKARCERRDPFGKKGKVIHLANGMLHLDTDPPQFRGFSPLYYSLNRCPVAFDPDAVCPRFLADLVFASMDLDNALLLQLMGGLYLTGRNSLQKLLILTGTGGAGKGTIARIFQQLIGMQNVKQLRTNLLDDRFELDNLDQASLLVGSDVEGDFLSCRGAKVIKALTGGDPLTMETKGGRKRDIVGEHNILITCNDRLRVKLDGDESAWKRRLLIIPFDRPATCKIDDFDRVLLAEEGSGILNWFIIGAMRLRELSLKRKDIQLTSAQEDCIESLLAESDSLRLFIKQCVRRERGASITSDEILAAYENYCATKGWSALPRKRFESQAGPLMMEFHQAAKRNDLKRGNTSKRGFMHVEIIETDTTTSEP